MVTALAWNARGDRFNVRRHPVADVGDGQRRGWIVAPGGAAHEAVSRAHGEQQLGELVAAGTLQAVLANPRSLTGKYLRGEFSIPVPKQRVKPSLQKGWLEIRGARENNLRDIDVQIDLAARGDP